jgi:hypothetical protein
MNGVHSQAHNIFCLPSTAASMYNLGLDAKMVLAVLSLTASPNDSGGL